LQFTDAEHRRSKLCEKIQPKGTITETSSPLDIEDLIGKYAFGDVGKNKKDEKKDAE
jgi:hypothetical protein